MVERVNVDRVAMRMEVKVFERGVQDEGASGAKLKKIGSKVAEATAYAVLYNTVRTLHTLDRSAREVRDPSRV